MRYFFLIIFIIFTILISACTPQSGINHPSYFNHNYYNSPHYYYPRNPNAANSLHIAQHTGAVIGTVAGGGFVHPHSYRWMMFSFYDAVMNSAINSLLGQ